MKKGFFPALIFIAFMLISLIPMSARAFDTPPSSPLPNTQYNTYGPSAGKLTMKVFTNESAEYNAFAAEQIDFMDQHLTTNQSTAIYSNPDFTTSSFTPFGLYEYDLNDAVTPFNGTSGIWYRKGLTCLIDRAAFINVSGLAGSALPAYNPCASMGLWNDPTTVTLATTGALKPDFVKAYEYFCNALGPPEHDPDREGYSTWLFTSPYPSPGPGSPPEPSVKNNHLSVYARTTGPDAAARTFQGVYLQQRCKTDFPAYFQANKAAAIARLSADGYNTTLLSQGFWPNIEVDNYSEPNSVTRIWVMTDYHFMVYTGAWSLGSTPDFLEAYTSSETPAAVNYAPMAKNYGSYLDPILAGNSSESNYDLYVDHLLAASSFAAAKPYVYEAEEEIMSQAGLIPMWYDVDYSACLTADYNAINAVGTGFSSWWNLFDAYPGTSKAPGYTTNTLTLGLSPDILNPNPVTSYSTSDWWILGEIYDSLIIGNPYNTTLFNPDLASNYSFSQTPGVNNGNTVLYAQLRGNVFWQDVPGRDRSAFTVDKGHELDGPFQNIPLTPLDVAFTIQYLRDMDYFTSRVTNYFIDDVDSVVVSSIYNSSAGWPYWNATAYPQGPPWENATWIASQIGGNRTYAYQYDFVQFDPTLSPYTIKINLNDQMTWESYYNCFALPILPMHLFKWIAMASWPNSAWPAGTPAISSMNLMPPQVESGGADLLYGTGPWILTNGTIGDHYTFLRYSVGTTYGPVGHTVTEQKSYFALCSARALPSVYMNPFRISGATGQTVNATLMISNVTNLYEFQAGCTFNPLEAHCIAVFNGGFLGSLGGSVIVTPGSILNSQGEVSPYSFALNGTAKAPTGSGALVIFEFQMVATGYSDVHAIDWIPVGTDLNEIPTKTIDYSTTSGAIVQIAGNPEGNVITPPYAGFNALKARAVSMSINGTTYNGNINFTLYSPDASHPNNNNYGFLNITIPKSLMTCNASSQWYFSLNGIAQSSRVVSENSTDTYISLQFTYSATGLEQVEILSVYYWSTGQFMAAISTTGKNVTVSPATCAHVTFTNITTTGTLTMNITQPSSNATGLKSAANSVFVSFQTNATYHGNVTLQFKYDPAGLTLADQKAIRIWLWNTASNTWRDITTYVNTTTDTVYGVSPHLSCFGITCTLTLLDNKNQQIQPVIQTPSSPPEGLPTSLEALEYYNITAPTQYKQPVTIQVVYNASAISLQQAQFLQMWLYNTTSTKWVEIPTTVDTVDSMIIGVSPHLSCFGITCPQPFPAGIAMVGASCSKTIVGQGYNVTINVSVKNHGTSTQGFTVFVYANGTAICSEQVSGLPPQGQTSVAFDFTASLTYGNYSISACGQPISWVKITIPGDVNGDGVVNILDVSAIAAHWLQSVPPSAPPELANADVNGDGVVNILDVSVCAAHWLQTLP